MSSGPFRTALTALSTLSVPGVARSYALDALPEKINRAQLPALLLVPMVDQARIRKYGEFGMAAPAGSKALASYLITHLLLYAPLGSGTGARTSLPGLVDLIDAYAAALRADPHLGSTLFYPAAYSVYIAPVTFGGTEYHAAQFWHTLVVET